ncbi:MAG: hypothetical protein HZB46_13030 [Solirubrobacterales bacterium]|nr:hypothetical protein [Solirubrobacterales bacterium]
MPATRSAARLPALAVAAALALLAPAAADGHAGHEGERPVVDGVAPAVAGVEVRVVPDSFGKLALSTRGGVTATVLGSAGQPILRVGPRGVEANAAAPEWYADNEPLGIAQVPAAAKASAPPRWRRVSVQRTWGWFDHRLHPAGKLVRRWAVPLRVDGRTVQVRGRVLPAAGALEVRPAGAAPVAGAQVAGVGQPALALSLRATGGRTVAVRGPDGELFARVGPKGAEVNVRSPAWAPTAQYRNRDLLGSVADPDAPPKMVLISPEPRLVWPDPRLLPAKALPAKATGEQEVARWSIPVSSGGASATLRGTTVLAVAKPEPLPAAQASTSARAPAGDDGGTDWLPIVLGGVAALAVLGGALVLVRARARRA